MKTLPLLMVLLVAVPVSAAAANLHFSSYSTFDVEQRGMITTSGAVNSLSVFVYIPQTDETQTTKIREIWGNDDICMLYDKTFEDLCTYQIVQDQFGNNQIKITGMNPGNNFSFYVKSSVTVKRLPYMSEILGDEFLKPTEKIQSSDPEISKKASEITIGKPDGFEKAAELTRWVHENIQYDLSFMGMKLPAKQVMSVRKGACDDMSTLLASMSRSLGYQTSYVAGYAFGNTSEENGFVGHAWNEITAGGRTYVVDPTWAQIPADTTHIKIARVADSGYTEFSVTGSSNNAATEMKLTPLNTSVTIRSIDEEPMITGEHELLADKLSQGYVVVRSDLSYDGCMLGKFYVQGCYFGDNHSLEALTGDRMISFCGKESVFSIFRIPNLKTGIIYNCPITIMPPTGDAADINASMSASDAAPPTLAMSIDKTSAELGSTVRVSAPGAHLFTTDGQYAFERGNFDVNGSMNVYAYSDGALAEQGVLASSEVPLGVEIISSQSATVGKKMGIGIRVTNAAGSGMPVTVRFRNESDTKTVAAGASAVFEFTLIPQDAEDNIVTAYVSSGSFLTSSSKVIEVSEEDWLSSFIASVSEFINKLFGGNA